QTNMAFPRIWVALTNGANTYMLDPAFKTSEPITGIDITNAMKLNTNDLMTAVGGTTGSGYIQNLSYSSLAGRLRDYTTNLLSAIQSNYPNYSVEQIIGGNQIVSSSSTPLPQTLVFPTYNYRCVYPVATWSYEPTALMATLSISISGSSYQWYMPAL